MRDMGSNKREKDVMFEEKRRDVWWKTTCRLMKNNVSFYRKQRVVCGSMSERKKWREESAKGGKKKGGEMEESVTLVTAKNQHCCWKARTRARKTRMCGEFVHFWRRGDFVEGTNDKLSLGLFSLETYYAVLLLILESKTRCIKRK